MTNDDILFAPIDNLLSRIEPQSTPKFAPINPPKVDHSNIVVKGVDVDRIRLSKDGDDLVINILDEREAELKKLQSDWGKDTEVIGVAVKDWAEAHLPADALYKPLLSTAAGMKLLKDLMGRVPK